MNTAPETHTASTGRPENELHNHHCQRDSFNLKRDPACYGCAIAMYHDINDMVDALREIVEELPSDTNGVYGKLNARARAILERIDG